MRTRAFLRTVGAVLCVVCAAPETAGAAAGKVLFVAGTATVERPGRAPVTLTVGAEVEAGDIVVTGVKSRVQLVMADGQRIALRAGTRLRIDEFALPAAVATPAVATAVQADGKTLLTLQRGGLRTRTSAIGKTNNAAYEVRTPVGTLGIRGTDYTAVFCQGDCDDAPGLTPGQPIPDGLYLGVDEGQILFEGRGLTLLLSSGEFAFIPIDALPLQRFQEPPGWLRGDGAGDFDLGGARAREPAAPSERLAAIGNRRSPIGGGAAAGDPGSPPGGAPELPRSGSSANGTTVDLTGGQLPARRSLAFVFGGGATPFAAAGNSLEASYGVDAAGNLTSFLGPFGTGGGFRTKAEVFFPRHFASEIAASVYRIGTATTTDAGAHAPTGLRWGRWTGGTATVTSPSGAVQNLNLANQSLHWLLDAPASAAPTLPLSGTQSYTLVGGTS
ncbi:MAG: FecR family protein, partial [Steroidobacteraceae bacterium]|nr:FecR family protein [Steroidobacteraceae bacterium]MDW8259922.1 FecR family protein [Gammaproteobacteria bacterium]